MTVFDAMPQKAFPLRKSYFLTQNNHESGQMDLRTVLMLIALGLAVFKFSENFTGFSFAPRDEIAASKAAEAASIQREIKARAEAPPLILDPSSFSAQTNTELTKQLRQEGFHVRCYGNLERKEKLHPSINQICWTQARTAWNIPLEGISFHFAGEQLQLVRIEFPNDQWPAAKNWFDRLPGEAAGIFGTDGQGHDVLGKSLSSGFLMIAKPPKNATAMVLWEAQELLTDRCFGKNRSFSEVQKQILCRRG